MCECNIDFNNIDKIVPGYSVFLNTIVKNKQKDKNREDNLSINCDIIKFVLDTYNKNREIVEKLFHNCLTYCSEANE